MEEQKWKYVYEGPVYVYGTLAQNKWAGQTWATSPSKAKSNLAFQWKKANGRAPGSKVELPGKVMLAR